MDLNQDDQVLLSLIRLGARRVTLEKLFEHTMAGSRVKKACESYFCAGSNQPPKGKLPNDFSYFSCKSRANQTELFLAIVRQAQIFDPSASDALTLLRAYQSYLDCLNGLGVTPVLDVSSAWRAKELCENVSV